MSQFRDLNNHVSPQKITIRTHPVYMPGASVEDYTGDKLDLDFVLPGFISMRLASYFSKFRNLNRDEMSIEESLDLLVEMAQQILIQDIRFRNKISKDWILDNLGPEEISQIVEIFGEMFGEVQQNQNF